MFQWTISSDERRELRRAAGRPALNTATCLGMLKSSAARGLMSRKSFWRIMKCMSLELIAAGVVICLFGMIALMPSFDGKWDA